MSIQIALESSTSSFENMRAEHQISRSSKNDRRAAKLIKKFALTTDPQSQERFRLKLRELQKGLTLEQREDLEKKKDQYLTFSSEIPETLDYTASIGKAVHQGVKCNGCSQLPIIGTRYKCLECVDFDYCEQCEGRSYHSHPFIQMKKPEQQYSGSSSMTSGKVTGNQRSKQASRKWKPFLNMRDNMFDDPEAYSGLEGYENDEDDFLVANESQRQEKMTETIQKIFVSEVEEKTQKLSELFCEKDSQKIKEFVAKNYFLSVDALVEKWLLA